MTTMALKRRGRVSSGAAMAVLVALVALALLSRVDAQIAGVLPSFRDFRRDIQKLNNAVRNFGGRVGSALESLPELGDDEDLGEGVDPTLENLSELGDEADLGSTADVEALREQLCRCKIASEHDSEYCRRRIPIPDALC